MLISKKRIFIYSVLSFCLVCSLLFSVEKKLTVPKSIHELQLPDLLLKMKCGKNKLEKSAYVKPSLKAAYRVEVINQGKIAAKNFYVALMLAKEVKKYKAIMSESSSRIKSTFLSKKIPTVAKRKIILLKAGESIFVNFLSLHIPDYLGCGEYQLIAMADSTYQVAELKENNNSVICPYFLRAYISKVIDSPTGESYGGMLFPEVALMGKHFGNIKGTKRVRFGSVEKNPTEWKNTWIWFSLEGFRECGYHQVYLIDGSQTISNKRNFLLKCWIWDISPIGGAPPGNQITINGRTFGNTQGTKKVKIGGLPANIVSWSHSQIIAVVPSLSPGNYKLIIDLNGQDVSGGGEDFTVL